MLEAPRNFDCLAVPIFLLFQYENKCKLISKNIIIKYNISNSRKKVILETHSVFLIQKAARGQLLMVVTI